MKRIRIVGLCLAGLCLTAVLGFGTTMSASATEVLFQLTNGGFPATFDSTGGKSSLETVTKEVIKCEKLENKGTIGSVSEGTKNAHLGTVTIVFKECTALSGLVACQSGTMSGVIELPNLIYHLGLADPGDKPALLLLPSVKFKCATEAVEVAGSVIGQLAAKVNEPKSEETLTFKQTSGVQELTTFLLSLTSPENEIMINQVLTTTKGSNAGVQSGETSTDNLLGFQNSSKQAAQILLVNG